MSATHLYISRPHDWSRPKATEDVHVDEVHISSRPDLWASVNYLPASNADRSSSTNFGAIAALAGMSALGLAAILWAAGVVHLIPGILAIGGSPVAAGGICFTIATRWPSQR